MQVWANYNAYNKGYPTHFDKLYKLVYYKNKNIQTKLFWKIQGDFFIFKNKKGGNSNANIFTSNHFSSDWYSSVSR